MDATIERLRADLAALDRAWSPGHHGRWAARRRSDLVDAAIVELYVRAGAPAGTALAAVGGSGRRQMLPRSDVDLLILHDPGVDPATLADAILYPLWDGGFEVGHAVRTPEGCAEVTADLDATTAMLDVRTMAGSERLVEQARAAVRDPLAADPIAFAERLRQDRERRSDRSGSAAHLLEPELKQGIGGLRDVHLLGWLAAALGRPLVEAGLARVPELEAVDAAEEFLVRTRSAVHLETGRRADRLVADLQPTIAAAMGFVDEPRLIAMDGLMRVLFAHARQVDLVVGLVLDRLGSDERAAEVDLPNIGAALAALADVAERGSVATPTLLDGIEGVEEPTGDRWDEATRAAFLRILRAGEPGVRTLDALDRLGVLTRLIPEWAEVRCRPQRDPYHRLTVDAHLTATLARAAEMLAGPGHPDDPVEREAATTVPDRDGLLLGALLHDVGKVGAGNHVPEGARIAGAVLDRIGVGDATRELATFLVGEHLLLPDTATRRDLADPALILDVAARVGTPERLAALYLLAKADGLATGPAAWTPWRRTLIRELVAKVQRAFDREEMGAGLAEQLTSRIQRVRELLVDRPERHVDGFVLRMPRGYFLTIEPERIARHAATILPPVGATEVRTAAAPGARAGAYELLVVAADRPGLLSWIAGALAVGGISILTAQVFTTADGVAVDVFEVEGAFEPTIDEARWRSVRSTLRRAIEGSISLERRVADKRGRYPAPAVDVPVTVRVDDAASDFFTVIEVGAADRIGLLHDITRTLAELKLDVHLAKVSTYDGRVVDTFYVRDTLGRKLSDPGQLAEVVEAVEQGLRA